MSQIQAQCDLERERSKGLQQELSQLVAQGRESRDQVKHYEAAIMELSTRVASGGARVCMRVMSCVHVCTYCMRVLRMCIVCVCITCVYCMCVLRVCMYTI